MPIINVALSAKPDADRARRLAGAISDLTQRHLRKDPKLTAIAFTHTDPAFWFAGGLSLAAQGVDSFWLDIKVVDGTNTKPELEAYLAEIFDLMRREFGRVHEESYILVHEVPAAAYGYGGRTQEFRFIAGRLQQAA
ncbi:MAG TPA: 4-oxalocrotonate tautomerase family protein [Alphaproteobacteria bacterium]|nr:4-oxalocrotonate tautomerase family protein [Alphaproteobacteria bacterium]